MRSTILKIRNFFLASYIIDMTDRAKNKLECRRLIYKKDGLQTIGSLFLYLKQKRSAS